VAFLSIAKGDFQFTITSTIAINWFANLLYLKTSAQIDTVSQSSQLANLAVLCDKVDRARKYAQFSVFLALFYASSGNKSLFFTLLAQ
jgi:hypothetical protein